MRPIAFRTFRAVALALCATWSPWAPAGVFDGLSDWIEGNLVDEQDGKLDLSDYLASTTGFLPVPIVITEPSVGFGLGAAVAYFHPPGPEPAEAHDHRSPPSITVGFAAGTENGTQLGGVAHSGVWRNDHLRYLGAVAAADVKLRFFPGEGALDRQASGIGFNVDGVFLYQQLQLRVRESNWWIGGNYLYIKADNRFEFAGSDADLLPQPLASFEQGGLSAYVEYDGRDSTFTPTSGLQGRLAYRNYDRRFGSDFDFDHVAASVHHYTPVGDWSSLGVRLEGETVSGDVPFFSYPFVNLRGIPALRYQGKDVLTTEVEYLWGFTPRWSMALFGGAGRTTPASVIGKRRTVGAGGVGIRYRAARKFGLQLGMDVARGPEETAVYLTVGSAW